MSLNKSMNTAGKILIIGASTFVAVELLLLATTGKGFILPTRKKRGELVMTSKFGRNQPITKKEYNDPKNKKNGYKFWKDLDKGYANAYYKAVWKSEHGKPTPTFVVDGETYNTKGGAKA